jgi:hypothetical protein
MNADAASASSLVNLLVAGWVRRHPDQTVFHLAAALDDFGVDVPEAVLQEIYDDEWAKLKAQGNSK